MRILRLVRGAAFLLGLTLGSRAGWADEILSAWRFEPTDARALDEIAQRFELVEREGQSWEVNVPASRQAEFLGLAPGARLVDPDLAATVRAQEREQAKEGTAYRSLDEVQRLMTELAQAHPELVQLVTYGTSRKDRPLLALKISDQVEVDEDEPELLLTAGTHGDELITVEVLLALLQDLVNSYEQDERIKALVNDRELFFVPVVNPDGFANRSRYANGVDPNRDYPYPNRPTREPNECIRDLMAFFQTRDFKGSIDFHAYGRLLMYPWAYKKDVLDEEDAPLFRTLGERMVERNGYRLGQVSRILYAAPGSSADYYYWQKRTLAFAVEVARAKVPSAAQIPVIVDEAREMTWRFIEHF